MGSGRGPRVRKKNARLRLEPVCRVSGGFGFHGKKPPLGHGPEKLAGTQHRRFHGQGQAGAAAGSADPQARGQGTRRGSGPVPSAGSAGAGPGAGAPESGGRFPASPAPQAAEWPRVRTPIRPRWGPRWPPAPGRDPGPLRPREAQTRTGRGAGTGPAGSPPRASAPPGCAGSGCPRPAAPAEKRAGALPARRLPGPRAIPPRPGDHSPGRRSPR
jgi:hypothetical protein